MLWLSASHIWHIQKILGPNRHVEKSYTSQMIQKNPVYHEHLDIYHEHLDITISLFRNFVLHDENSLVCPIDMLLPRENVEVSS